MKQSGLFKNRKAGGNLNKTPIQLSSIPVKIIPNSEIHKSDFVK